MTTSYKMCIIVNEFVFSCKNSEISLASPISSSFFESKNMNKINLLSGFCYRKLSNLGFLILFLSVEVLCQMPQVVVSEDPEPELPVEDYTWWYILLVLLAVGLAGAIMWLKASKKAEQENQTNQPREFNEPEAVDFDKELEWFRKNQKVINKKKSQKSELPTSFPKTSSVLKQKNGGSDMKANSLDLEGDNGFAAKMPIFSIERLEKPRPFDFLPISNDPALLSAIEQTHDEFEEDEAVRELALKVLAAFKTRNAVEAISEVALYDLSSFIRSKAVSVLAEYSHESVFETILLACADPTREVRAAAARGLLQLNFDRADCWARILETGDEYRIKQAARAAIEADLAERYFDRLVHEDIRYSYEAFAFVALVLRSGETERVFNALHKHRDENVRQAIFHVIKIMKEPNALEGLYSILESEDLSPEMREEADRLVGEIGLAAV